MPHRRPGAFDPWTSSHIFADAPHRHATCSSPTGSHGGKIIPVKWFLSIGNRSSYTGGMDLIVPAAFFLSAAIVVLVLTGGVLSYLRRRAILDIPTERSSQMGAKP